MGNDHTHYTVSCSRYSSDYSGYSKSDYDYYCSRYSSDYCYICIDEENRENARIAREKALKAQRKEAERLEAEQRRQILEQERKRREAREGRKKRLRQNAERDRADKAKKMKDKLQNDLDAERERVRKAKCEKPQPPKQNKNVYAKWMKLDTLQIVQDLGNRVKICSAAGQDIIDNVENIENELKNSVKDHYDTIEPEIERYKKYGQEMRDMNKVFIDEFSKTLNDKYIPEMKEAATSIDDQIRNKQENEQKIKDLLESAGSVDSKMATFLSLQKNYNQKKTKFVQKIEGKLDGINKAIETMESKLNVMGTYYDEMVRDHDKFIAFCIEHGDKYGEEMTQIKNFLEQIGVEIKGKKRGLYEGQSDDVERKIFSEEYDVYTVHKTTQKIDNSESKAKNARIGTWVGMGVGAITGSVFGGPIGLVYGGALGAAVGGCLIGGILDKFDGNNVDRFETKTTVSKSIASVTLSNADYYDGDQQNTALQRIIDAMEPEIKKCREKLSTAVGNTKQQKIEAQDFKKNISGMHAKIKAFKNDINGIKQSLKTAKIDDEFQKNMDSKCLDLFEKVNKMVLGLKYSSNSKSKWKDDDDTKQNK